MELESRVLNFAAVDDLGFAGAKGRLEKLPSNLSFTSHQIGPLLELRHLQGSGTIPSARPWWLNVGGLDELMRAIAGDERQWFCRINRAMGMMKLDATPRPQEWTDFAMNMKRAGVLAGLSSDWAAQMTAALRELESNIHEHSGAVGTGLIAYRGAPGEFEFVVADLGLGLLATLREAPDYALLTDHGEALRLALTDGASRLGAGLGRGYGFRPLFTGLANRRASLRFRSGTASLTIDGTSPSLVHARLATKAFVRGFFASISCSI